MYIRYDLSDSHNPQFDLILLFIVFTNGKCGICLSVCSKRIVMNQICFGNDHILHSTLPYHFQILFWLNPNKILHEIENMIHDLRLVMHEGNQTPEGGGATMLHKYWCVEKTSVHSLWLFRFRFSPIALLNKPTMVHIWAQGYVHGRASSCPHQH